MPLRNGRTAQICCVASAAGLLLAAGKRAWGHCRERALLVLERRLDGAFGGLPVIYR